MSLCKVLRNKGTNEPAVCLIPHAWEGDVFNYCEASSYPRDKGFLAASYLCIETQIFKKKHGFIEIGGEERGKPRDFDDESSNAVVPLPTDGLTEFGKNGPYEVETPFNGSVSGVVARRASDALKDVLEDGADRRKVEIGGKLSEMVGIDNDDGFT